MTWHLNSDRPIFLQIVEKIQSDIVAGHYAPGDKLPSVRELASEAAVNPNTIQKAYAELEQTGLIFSKRTCGRFIAEDKEMIKQTKKQLAEKIIQDFLQNMKQLGFQLEETLELAKKSGMEVRNGD
ncbi:MAG: GntR family transcriptional regulator [Lachnospiraceae bacterium]|nr:GntR family transcriptional regulator [Lachnospiraceae bacterium]